MRFPAFVAFVTAMVFAVMPASAAPTFDTPEALITYAYQPYASGQFPDDSYELFAPNLRELVETTNANAGEDQAGALDFDPFIDAQDFGDVSTTVDKVTTIGDHVEIAVTVSNFGETVQMAFTVVKTDAGWLISDIARIDGEYPWRLTELLADNPLLN